MSNTLEDVNMAGRKRRKKSRQRPQTPVHFYPNVPTYDYFEDISLPDDIDQILDNLVNDIKTGYFLEWEAVLCQEQGLPLTKKQKKALAELINFGDQEDDRILYIDGMPRPRQSWYEIARKIAPHILREPLRTVDGGFWAMHEGWPELVEALEKFGSDLSLPPDAESPLDIFPLDLRHRLWLQVCFDALVGLGQDEELTLASESQREYRIEWFINCLRRHKDTVEFLDLTLETLLTRVILPPKDEELFVEIMLKELGLTAPQDRLVFTSFSKTRRAMTKYPSDEEEIELPPIKPSAPRPAAGHSQSSYPLCPNDGFPMVEIDDQLECCVEALDRCVGQRTVVDVVQRGKTTYYVFDDGHELPLLCGCCGQGLLVNDLEAERKKICGRRLEAMSIETSVLEKDGREFDELVLEFSKLGIFSQPLHVPVAFEVAARLRHPAAGPKRRQVSTSKKKARSRRKGRSRQKRGRKKR